MYTTPQEQFWAENFGDDYSKRNTGPQRIASNTALFSKVLQHTGRVDSLIEYGANIGLNLHSLRTLLPEVELSAIEINSSAADVLESWGEIAKVYRESILEFTPDRSWDLSFTKGVLIHINPEKLPLAYDKLYESSHNWLLVAEYYNPQPTVIPYRGHDDRLFKRDFAGELLDRFANLQLIDYGFCYHRDPLFPQDDISWFLMKKC